MIQRVVRTAGGQVEPKRVLAVQFDDGPVTVNGEEMTREAFYERYPAGPLIQFVVVNAKRSPTRAGG